MRDRTSEGLQLKRWAQKAWDALTPEERWVLLKRMEEKGPRRRFRKS
jgi:hypothetical protein